MTRSHEHYSCRPPKFVNALSAVHVLHAHATDYFGNNNNNKYPEANCEQVVSRWSAASTAIMEMETLRQFTQILEKYGFSGGEYIHRVTKAHTQCTCTYNCKDCNVTYVFQSQFHHWHSLPFLGASDKFQLLSTAAGAPAMRLSSDSTNQSRCAYPIATLTDDHCVPGFVTASCVPGNRD